MSLLSALYSMKYVCKSLRESLLYFASEYAKQVNTPEEWWCKYLNWIKHPDGITVLAEEISKRAGKKIGNDVWLSYNWLKDNEFILEEPNGVAIAS